MSGRFVERLDRFTDRAESACAVVACALVLVMVLAICGDVALRALTRSGLVWGNAVAEYALYATTFLAAPLLLRRGQHIRVDIVLRALPPRVAWFIEFVVDVSGAAISVLFLVASLRVLFNSYAQGSMVMREVMFPEWWLYVPIPFVMGLLAIEFALRMHRLALGERCMRDETTSAA